jgi:alkylation response protein AidB-like acyl-CoA dehydrogenase
MRTVSFSVDSGTSPFAAGEGLLTREERTCVVDKPLVIRRNDFTLNNDDIAVRDAFAMFLRANCSVSRVKRNEPLGFDPDLWQELCELGALSMSVAAESGGDGGTLVQSALVAELCGEVAAPLPFAEQVAVARLLSRTRAAEDQMSEVFSGRRIIGLAPGSIRGVWPQYIGSGAVADGVIGILDTDLVFLEPREKRPRAVATQGCMPIAKWSPDECVVTRIPGGGPGITAFATACDEYKVLTSSALTGLASKTIDLAARFASERSTRGVPIGSLQGISHPLVEVKVRIEGVRQTARKAAWYCEFEPEGDPKLPSICFIGAARAADEAGRVAVHTHGGLGVMADSDVALYFLRARSWASTVGHIPTELLGLAGMLREPRYRDVVYPSML